MISSRRPPTYMPATPLSQPGITCPAPGVNVKGWLVHDDWMTLPLEYVASTYWTVALSPARPSFRCLSMRSALSNDFGGAPDGTVILSRGPGRAGRGAVGFAGWAAVGARPAAAGKTSSRWARRGALDAFEALEAFEAFELLEGVDGEELRTAGRAAAERADQARRHTGGEGGRTRGAKVAVRGAAVFPHAGRRPAAVAPPRAGTSGRSGATSS